MKDKIESIIVSSLAILSICMNTYNLLNNKFIWSEILKSSVILIMILVFYPLYLKKRHQVAQASILFCFFNSIQNYTTSVFQVVLLIFCYLSLAYLIFTIYQSIIAQKHKKTTN